MDYQCSTDISEIRSANVSSVLLSFPVVVQVDEKSSPFVYDGVLGGTVWGRIMEFFFFRPQNDTTDPTRV